MFLDIVKTNGNFLGITSEIQPNGMAQRRVVGRDS